MKEHLCAVLWVQVTEPQEVTVSMPPPTMTSLMTNYAASKKLTPQYSFLIYMGVSCGKD